MRDEIDTILDCDVRLTHQNNKRSTYNLYHEEQVIVENGSDSDRLFDAIQSLQQSLPDDLEERREAAAEFLGFSKDISQLEAFKFFASADTDRYKGNAERCAYKRVLGIHTGDFSAESEYYPPEPEYPEQWLEHMSREDTEFLHCVLQHGDSAFDDPMTCSGSPDSLLGPGFLRQRPYKSTGDDLKYKVYASKAPFLTGGLELPEFLDEEGLR